jgi:dihydropteroate synthase
MIPHVPGHCKTLILRRAIRAAGCAALISVDTRKAEVAAAAVQAGMQRRNDTTPCTV